MNKCILFFSSVLAVIQLHAQIKTSAVNVEPTNNITTISGQTGIGTTTPGVYNLAANFTTFNSLLDVDGEVIARDGLRVVGPSIGWGSTIDFPVFTASLHHNSRNNGSMTGWVAKVHSVDASDPVKLSFYDGTSNSYNQANNALLDNLDSSPTLTLESHNNRVGIGGISNPQDFLHVPDGNIRIGTDAWDYARLHYSGGAMSITNQWISDAAYIRIGAGNDLNAVTVMGTGRVGIQTTAPSYDLDVNGNWALRQNGYFYNSTAYAFESSSGQYMHYRTTGGRGYVGMDSSNDLILQTNGGNVGIGITPSGAKLHVNGNIKATPTNITWPDFVFKSDYELPSLEEVEEHIAEKGHLENIPSEEEVEAEGIDMVSLDAKLLQKIEELTLYLIKQNKEIQELKEKVKSLENQ